MLASASFLNVVGPNVFPQSRRSHFSRRSGSYSESETRYLNFTRPRVTRYLRRFQDLRNLLRCDLRLEWGKVAGKFRRRGRSCGDAMIIDIRTTYLKIWTTISEEELPTLFHFLKITSSNVTLQKCFFKIWCDREIIYMNIMHTHALTLEQ